MLSHCAVAAEVRSMSSCLVGRPSVLLAGLQLNMAAGRSTRQPQIPARHQEYQRVAVPGPNRLFGRLQRLGSVLGPDPADASLQLTGAHLPASADVPRRDRTSGIATVCVQSLPDLTPTGVGCPPGMLATRIARGAVVPAGREARPSRANVRPPPPRSSPRRSHSSLTACPGPRPLATVGGRERGRAFGACCFAGKLRSPGGPSPVPPWPSRDPLR
jgi:hypothetical protein